MSDVHLLSKLERLRQLKELPEFYLSDYMNIVAPLIEQWTATHFNTGMPSIWGIQGSQGSGKSTISEFIKTYLSEKHNLLVQVCSIDDFYLTRAERSKLAADVHPLFKTRGVPGTHDTRMMLACLNELKRNSLNTVPRFNKAEDERYDKSNWPLWAQSPDILIFEGWCVGMPAQTAQELSEPVNELEEKEDALCVWRKYVNGKLRNEYAQVFDCLDKLLVIQAPSFDCVYQWRLQQEKDLQQFNESKGKESGSGIMGADEIKTFIAHYQRLTEHGFAHLPDLADATLHLNDDHQFKRMIVNESCQ